MDPQLLSVPGAIFLPDLREHLDGDIEDGQLGTF